MNKFDQFVKHELRTKYYARYADDFVIIADNREKLERLVVQITNFLSGQLALSLHPHKVSIQAYTCGVDFLGQIIFPHYRLLRAKTRKRIFKQIRRKVERCNDGLISEKTLHHSLQSYLGVLSHTNTYGDLKELKNQVWFWSIKDN